LPAALHEGSEVPDAKTKEPTKSAMPIVTAVV